jgi:hypothetical protein
MEPDRQTNPVIARVGDELRRAARHRARRRPHRRLAGVLVAVVALAGTSAASALTQTGPLAHVLSDTEVAVPLPRAPVDPGGDCDRKDLADGRAERTVRRLDPRVRALMGVFRRPQRPAEGVSNCGYELEDGENLTLGRRVTLPDGQRAYVWPARHAVCYGVAGLGGCPPVSVIERDGVAIGAGFNADTPRGMFHAAGVARDGVRALVFTVPDGRETSTPVVDNVFAVLLPRENIAVERVDRDGSRHAIPHSPVSMFGALADRPAG